MAAKTESDIESDEEFEDELVGSGPFKVRSTGVFGQIRNQFSKNRLDRVEKLLSILPTLRDHHPSHAGFPKTICIDFLATAAFEHMPPEGCSDFLRLIFRHCGETISEGQLKSVVLLATFHRDTSSVQLLREKFGNAFVEKAIEELRNGPCVFSSRLLWVSEHGNVADLKGFLTPVFEDRADSDRPDRMTPNDLRHCMSKCQDLIEKIAELGRFDLVEALIGELQSKVGKVLETMPMIMVGLAMGILRVAWRKGDFPMASSVLSALCTCADAKEPCQIQLSFICAASLHDTALCPAQFLESILAWTRANIASDAYGHKIYLKWLGKMARVAIWLHGRPQLEILLDEIDRIGDLFQDFPGLLSEVLHSKSTSILRFFILRYPEASINHTRSDPVRVLQDHHWTVGARILVEAGAATSFNIPQEYAEVFKLSLEDRCRIVARRNVKHPLEQNVHQLPLPLPVKRRILYRRRQARNTSGSLANVRLSVSLTIL